MLKIKIPMDSNTFTQGEIARIIEKMKRTDHVIFATIDALRPDGLKKAETPAMDYLIAKGSSSMTGQTIYPPVTLPAHSSLFYGVGPAKHGICNNDFPLNPNLINFTTLFDHLAKNKKANIIFSSWEKFRNTYSNVGTTDLLHLEKISPDGYALKPELESLYHRNYKNYGRSFAEAFVKKRPNVAYIYLEMPDVYGHKYRWMSDEYLHSVNLSDQIIGGIVDVLQQARIEDQVTIIITADHGGCNYTHHELLPENMTIPWIAAGKGIRKNYTIKTAVNLIDTTSTICDLLGVKPHISYEGKILEEIYG